MKEFLVKRFNGDFFKVTSDHKQDDWIEIPEGAECLTKDGFFWKGDNLDEFFSKYHGVWRVDECDMSNDEYLQNNPIVWQREKESLNDQYTEIERVRHDSIRKTLNERQAQYGCFEDVAHVTQGMIALMRQCGYDKMPTPHQMALSMIASKIARLVNGDFNHKDSWHDIGGYARLIEDLIGDESKVTF